MKNIILITILFVSSIGFSQTVNSNQSLENLSAITAQIRIDKRSTIPNYIEFQKGKEPSVESVISMLNEFSKNKIEVEEISTFKDQIGFIHVKYNQKINGRLLQYSNVTFHFKNNKLVSVSGNLKGNLPSNNSVSINEKSALNFALNKIGATLYKWEVPSEEEFIKRETGNADATFFPKGELVYLPTKKGIRLAYRFNIYATEPLSRADYFVDAANGVVLFVNNQIHHTDVNATATTGYSGTKIIKTDSLSPTSYRLRETGRGLGIETYDMNNGTSHGSAVDFTDSDNNWTDSTNGDHYARDAHWGAEMTYDYFLTVHGRNSIDNAGFKLKSYVHYKSNYVNAYWDGNRMTYGDGNGTSTSPLTTMAIAGHEITHGLTSKTADLVYYYESGALNESFSDIFGVSIDYWSRPTQANWLMGDEIYISGSSYFRSMSNPNAKNDPDTYKGTHWHTSSSDNGGVHTNSGVQNFWFYLLVNGGSGTNDNGDAYNVPALGFDTASRIAFRNLTVKLNSSSQYMDARTGAIQSATDLYGACSPAVIAVTKAWYAVGVGNDYIPVIRANFSSLDTVGCKVPFTVNFLNNSSNSTSFIWSFGDGSFSTSTNPTHTYTGYGPYNVQLIASGSLLCGTTDTLIKTGYVTVDTNKPCPTILPKNGSLSSTTCFGTLYDDGGASGNYSPNQNSYFTISPTGATSVTLRFPHFDVEPGLGFICNSDYLEVYDGNSTSATLIGRYCNTIPPPATITSTTGAITVKFHTDGGLHLSGFKMDWSCSAWTSPYPLARFIADDTIPCKGQTVTYTNTSYNATSYQWSFPGGTPSTSTAMSPTVVYNTSGNYTATLIAINATGNDTLKRVNYISVPTTCTLVLPAGGSAPVQTNCLGKLVDDGGLSGDYSANQTTYVTIAPTGATSVKLDFVSFDVEADGCIYDYMMIYDGPNTSSSLLGKYCNSTLPPNPLFSTGNALTIKFYADAGLELDGFEIDWSCSLTGLEENSFLDKVKIYPNPSSEFLNLEVDFNRVNTLNVRLVDMLGKVYYANNSTEKALQFTDKINVSDLANGTYIVFVNDKAYKFIKQ